MDLPLDQAFWGQFFLRLKKKHWVAPMNFDFNNNCVCEFQNYTPSIFENRKIQGCHISVEVMEKNGQIWMKRTQSSATSGLDEAVNPKRLRMFRARGMFST